MKKAKSADVFWHGFTRYVFFFTFFGWVKLYFYFYFQWKNYDAMIGNAIFLKQYNFNSFTMKYLTQISVICIVKLINLRFSQSKAFDLTLLQFNTIYVLLITMKPVLHYWYLEYQLEYCRWIGVCAFFQNLYSYQESFDWCFHLLLAEWLR